MLSIDERRARLRERFARWTPRTLDGWLAHCAAEYGEAPLVITDERTISYAETAEWAGRLGGGLATLGVRPGDHVGLIMANYLEFVPLKFAIARAGAVAIPLNYLYRTGELGYVLRQSRCSVLITMSGFAGLDYLAMLDAIGPLPDLRHVVQFRAQAPARDGVLTVDELAALGGTAVSDRAPEDVGDMLYTSGTTGSPKGVLITHDAARRTAYASALTRAFEEGRRILFSLPCYHMFGYVEGLLAAMVVGGAIIPRTTFDPADYLASVARHRATDMLCVPTMTMALLDHPDRRIRDLSSLVAVLSGAAPAPVRLWERVRDELDVTEMTTGYGMTECGGAMTLTLPEDPLGRHASTVGAPKLAGAAGLPGGALVEYRTVDPLTGETLPVGAEGELASRGPATMLGFFDKPEETAAALRDGWLRSGDLGVVGPDGYLRLTGRGKELYKSGGELVMPKEIEELLTRHPGVSQAYAVGVPDQRWGEAGCVWIVRAPGNEITAAEVVALCREKLARFKVPKHVLFLAAEDLPTTPTGKVRKFRLARLARERLP